MTFDIEGFLRSCQEPMELYEIREITPDPDIPGNYDLAVYFCPSTTTLESATPEVRKDMEFFAATPIHVALSWIDEQCVLHLRSLIAIGEFGPVDFGRANYIVNTLNAAPARISSLSLPEPAQGEQPSVAARASLLVPYPLLSKPEHTEALRAMFRNMLVYFITETITNVRNINFQLAPRSGKSQ